MDEDSHEDNIFAISVQLLEKKILTIITNQFQIESLKIDLWKLGDTYIL